MKKLIISYVQILMSVLLFTGGASAQKNQATASIGNAQNMTPGKFLPSTSFNSATPDADITEINAKSVKNFNRNYKSASAVRWYKSDKTTVASFTENGKRTSVVYLPNGRWLHTLISYDETQLAEDIKSLVHSKYRKYNITWVVEVHEGDMTSYFIMIDGEKDFKQVIVYEDEVFTHKEYKKSN